MSSRSGFFGKDLPNGTGGGKRKRDESGADQDIVFKEESDDSQDDSIDEQEEKLSIEYDKIKEMLSIAKSVANKENIGLTDSLLLLSLTASSYLLFGKVELHDGGPQI
jgi:hypothetical protein